MSMTIGNATSHLGDVKGNFAIGAREFKQGAPKTFAEVQANEIAANSFTGSVDRERAATTGSGTQSLDLEGSQTTDQLLLQRRMANQLGVDPKASLDSTRVSQQSSASESTYSPQATTDTLSAFQGQDQLLKQSRPATQQSEDPKWAADGSNVVVQAAAALMSNTVQAIVTTPLATLTTLEEQADRP
ncbi:hypothetical protein HZ993_03990 [Rhodoferax sp. AJA081-3]|uniref:hypothetical protein n=1 Tax=Rhodoferax sp. AJA081-3 TaxID=2752316 RepID=UPI001ADFED39|nr:hypothetical protein [Rhodoferax sp. AJA081-3]QTN29015.1 hypothetical protein HZ993_03990 [Rhodoferax sp. AJA081-3]